jgi:hypothetical protein
MSRKKRLATGALCLSVFAAHSAQASVEGVIASEEGVIFSVHSGVSYFNMDPGLPTDLVMHTTHPADTAFVTKPPVIPPVTTTTITTSDTRETSDTSDTEPARTTTTTTRETRETSETQDAKALVPVINSPGVTILDEVDITFYNFEVNLEIGHRLPITIDWTDNLSWGISYVLKVPLAEEGRSEKLSENDIRPPAQRGSVYTKVSDMSCQHEAGLKAKWWLSPSDKDIQYSINYSLYLGYWQMAFDKGWGRAGHDQTEWKSDASGVSISPQIGFALDTANLNFTVFTAYRAISLDYDHDMAGRSDSATGVEFGASLGWKF